MYVSATGVSDVTDMAYMDRMGLWGPETAFPSFRVFHDGIKDHGLGVLELLGTGSS